MANMVQLPNKTEDEIVLVEFDFLSSLAVGETISGASVTCAVYSGADTAAADLIDGAATVDGSVVTQSIDGGVEGVIYQLICTADTDEDQELQLIGLMAVIPTAV